MSDGDYTDTYVRKLVNAHNIDEILRSKVLGKVIILDNVDREGLEKTTKERTQAQRELQVGRILDQEHEYPLKEISAKSKRRLRLFEPENLNYDKLLVLNQLWETYAHTLDSLEKIAKGDLHGAILKVVRTKNPTLLGISGIVLQETQNTFRLLGVDNKLRTISKSSCDFELVVNNKSIVIYGQNFAYRPAERTKRKFKSMTSLHLNHF